MTYMTDTPRPEQSVPMHAGAPDYGQMQAPTVRLRRFGARPLSFQGEELAMAMSFTPELPYWFEINLFRASDGTFPVAIKQFFQSEDEKDIARAWVAPTLDEAIGIVEQFDPAHDVPVTCRIDTEGMSAAEMEATAQDLQAQVAHARNHYASLVGELLHGIDAA